VTLNHLRTFLAVAETGSVHAVRQVIDLVPAAAGTMPGARPTRAAPGTAARR
jgi:hypothetical protein